MSWPVRLAVLVLSIWLVGLSDSMAGQSDGSLQIVFDYRYDTSDFFSEPVRRIVLEQAGAEISRRLRPSLAPVIPAGTNHWSALTIRPDTGFSESLLDLQVGQDTIVVFVGARELGGLGDLGIAEPGGSAAKGSDQWRNLVRTRNSLPGGTWGGSIAFDDSSYVKWQFETNNASQTLSNVDAFDFFSVAVHELGHLLGLGTSLAWHEQADGTFHGAYSVLVFEGPILLEGENHWTLGVTSRTVQWNAPQEAVMSASLSPGQRRFLTVLDLAALLDIGWEIIALEPPRLSISGETVTWPVWAMLSGFLLEWSGAAAGPWLISTLPWSVHDARVSVDGRSTLPGCFFRLRGLP